MKQVWSKLQDTFNISLKLSAVRPEVLLAELKAAARLNTAAGKTSPADAVIRSYDEGRHTLRGHSKPALLSRMTLESHI